MKVAPNWNGSLKWCVTGAATRDAASSTFAFLIVIYDDIVLLFWMPFHSNVGKSYIVVMHWFAMVHNQHQRRGHSVHIYPLNEAHTFNSINRSTQNIQRVEDCEGRWLGFVPRFGARSFVVQKLHRPHGSQAHERARAFLYRGFFFLFGFVGNVETKYCGSQTGAQQTNSSEWLTTRPTSPKDCSDLLTAAHDFFAPLFLALYTILFCFQSTRIV